MEMEQESIIDLLSNDIIATYSKYLRGAATDYLPNRGEVTHIINLLRRLVFPGYFEDSGANMTEYVLRHLIRELENKLRSQVNRVLHMGKDKDINSSDMYGRAGEICRQFLGKIPYLIDLLHDDVQATYDGDPAAQSKDEIIFAYPGIFAISVYRFAHELQLLSVPLIPRMMTEYAHSRTGIDIHPGAEIGRYFCIDHGTGIVIGETTEIGEHVKLYQGVTLGALSTRGGQNLRGEKRHPTIEDEVTIYSGASILGGATVIGRKSVIGGNVFITSSVPAGTKISLLQNDSE